MHKNYSILGDRTDVPKARLRKLLRQWPKQCF